MILVCPSCDAKFKVPDGAIPAAGRTVRCAKCKNSWHAKPVDALRKPAPRPVPRPAAHPVRPTAPAQPPQRPQAPPPQGFDGELDQKAAEEAAALRRSVSGTLGVEDEMEHIRSGPEPEMLDEGMGPAESIGDDLESADSGFSSEIDDGIGDGDGGDAFGIKASLKKTMGDDFPDDFDDDGTYPDGPDADEEYDEEDFLARRRADQRRLHERTIVGRERKLMTAGWALLLVFWLAVFYAFAMEEERMRYKFPGTSDFVYGMLEGLSDRERFRPEDGEALTPSPALAEVYIRANLYPNGSSEYPDGVSIETVDGKQALVLRGYVENAGRTGANVPQVNAAILDANGRVLVNWVFNPPGLLIRRGQRLDFTEYYSPIPPGAASAKVDVIEGSKSTTDARNEQ